MYISPFNCCFGLVYVYYLSESAIVVLNKVSVWAMPPRNYSTCSHLLHVHVVTARPTHHGHDAFSQTYSINFMLPPTLPDPEGSVM